MTVLLIGINVGFYFVPIDYSQLAEYAVLGVFVLTALATATIVCLFPISP
jgi:ABC-type transport system involved in cytochrome c biogenesis permease subunit